MKTRQIRMNLWFITHDMFGKPNHYNLYIVTISLPFINLSFDGQSYLLVEIVGI